MIGQVLGSYQVVSKLGEGGMGEVYRARDTKLNRDVAIKVLPEAFALDADRLARFTREAQVLASLNHPNIATIHGIESNALVMELVDGQDLSEMIGGLETQAALLIARQIIDALEAAHEQGIVHRDLKPQNIKVRADGTVKVLDFGLAKAMDPGAAEATPYTAANSPTLTARATQMGMIIGTAAYMAPEQARGRAVDRRADIWAFGVVFYEMLTGKRAFEGEDISVTLANVIKETPTFDALPPDLPAPIRRLLRRCLEKDPKRRLGAISDARLELDEAVSPTEAPPVAVPAARRSGIARWERAIWASVATVAVVAAVWLAWPASSDGDEALPMARFEISPPGEGQFIGAAPRMAISPDGRSLAFTATSKSNEPDQMWIRRLDSLEVRPVAGTQTTPDAVQPQSPFWSPDSRQLAYFVQTSLQDGVSRGSRLLTVDMSGGAPRPICELPSNNASGTWNREGVLLVSSQGSNGIQRVSAAGGVPTPVTTLDSATKEIAHLWPEFLPDGRHFLYQAQTEARSSWAIFAGAIDSADRHLVVKSDYARFAAPDLLLYVAGENLLAQRMDMQTRTLTGDPVVLANGILRLATNGRSGFSVSDAGVLVYSSDPDQVSGLAERRLTWFDRRGTSLGSVGPPVSAFNFRLSPGGDRVALVELLGDSTTGRQVWVADLSRNVKSPLTSSVRATSPTWSDDGRRVMFSSAADDGRVTIAERVASGATPVTTLHGDSGPMVFVIPLDESRDGTQVVFTKSNGGIRSLFVLSKADGKVVPYLEDGFDHPQASLSHDGRWLAYTTNESGPYEVVVQPFPDPTQGKWPISTGGGSAPRWRRDGRELFYVNNSAQLMAVPVTTHQRLVPGIPKPLFQLSLNAQALSTAAYSYDVSPDGQRILASVLPGGLGTGRAAAVPLTVVTNWTSLMKMVK